MVQDSFCRLSVTFFAYLSTSMTHPSATRARHWQENAKMMTKTVHSKKAFSVPESSTA